MSEETVPLREIRLKSTRPYRFGDYQLNYLNYRTRRLIPNTRIYWDGQLIYQTNALGCKGRDVTASRPLVAFLGDSVVHGANDSSFVQFVNLPGCEVLNAGIEGLMLPDIVERFLELKGHVHLVAAAVHAGWHNIAYNQVGEDYWAEQLDRIVGVPVIAHFTLAADFNEQAVQHGIDDALERVHEYSGWGGMTHATLEGRQLFVQQVERFNNFIQGYCREKGRLLIDFRPEVTPRGIADLGSKFIDTIHFRPTIYPDLARIIEGVLTEPVAQVVASEEQGS